MKTIPDYNYMCGLVGYTGKSKANPDKIRIGLWSNESRGRHSTGVYGTSLLKATVEASNFIKLQEFDKVVNANQVLGHTRFKTTGDISEENAHPFKIGKVIGTHNGWVINECLEAICKQENMEVPDVDSQLIFMMLDKYKNDFSVIRDIDGAMALAYLYEGNLYLYRRPSKPLYVGFLDNGIYYSSIEGGLLHMGIQPSHVQELEPDILHVFKDGRLLRAKPIEQSDVALPLDSSPSSWRTDGSGWESKYPRPKEEYTNHLHRSYGPYRNVTDPDLVRSSDVSLEHSYKYRHSPSKHWEVFTYEAAFYGDNFAEITRACGVDKHGKARYYRFRFECSDFYSKKSTTPHQGEIMNEMANRNGGGVKTTDRQEAIWNNLKEAGIVVPTYKHKAIQPGKNCSRLVMKQVLDSKGAVSEDYIKLFDNHVQLISQMSNKTDYNTRMDPKSTLLVVHLKDSEMGMPIKNYEIRVCGDQSYYSSTNASGDVHVLVNEEILRRYNGKIFLCIKNPTTDWEYYTKTFDVEASSVLEVALILPFPPTTEISTSGNNDDHDEDPPSQHNNGLVSAPVCNMDVECSNGDSNKTQKGMGEHSDQGETKQPYALLPRYGNGDASEEQPEAGDTDEDVETTGEYYDKYVASEILTLAASTKDPRVQDLYERACRINDMHHIVRTCIHAIMIQELGYTKCLKTLLPELSDSLDEELDRIEDEASYLMTAYYESLDSDGIEEGKVIPLITEGESHHGSEDDVNQLPFTNI